MRKITNTFNWTAVISAVLFSLCFVRCAKDDTEDNPTPTNPVDPKTRFVADWNCSEVSRRDPPAGQFQVHMLNGTGDSLVMENCYAVGFANKAKLIVYGDSLKFAPTNQQIANGIFLLNGKGKLINSSTIKMTYVIDDGNPIKDTVDATFTK
jgi:hypothetical protein